MVKDETNINHAAKPSKSRGTKTIHYTISHSFDKLVTIFSKILVLMLSLALPKAYPGISDILNDLPTMIKGCIISNEFYRGTLHTNAILKSSKKTLSTTTLNLKNVGNVQNQTNKHMSSSFTSINSGCVGINHISCIGFMLVKKICSWIW